LCGELINIADYEDHLQEIHTNIPCDYCKKEFNKKNLFFHLETCSFKPFNCTFCELEVCKENLEEHEKNCGSKTEVCEKCLKYVQLKYFKTHLLHECDPGLNLNNNINIEEVPIQNKNNKNKKYNNLKIGALKNILNNMNKDKPPKLDSPFDPNFNIDEFMNNHPVVTNLTNTNNNNEHNKKNKKK